MHQQQQHQQLWQQVEDQVQAAEEEQEESGEVFGGGGGAGGGQLGGGAGRCSEGHRPLLRQPVRGVQGGGTDTVSFDRRSYLKIICRICTFSGYIFIPIIAAVIEVFTTRLVMEPFIT